jgi:hypothetical protein
LPDSIDFKRECIEPELPGLSVRRQCELLGLNRSSWYYRPLGESAEGVTDVPAAFFGKLGKVLVLG